MTEPDTWTPDPDDPADVARAIVRTKDHIARGVRIVDRAEKERDARATEFSRAYAQAFLGAEGPERTRRYQADVATIGQRQDADQARQALGHAERIAESLAKELFAWQSILKHLTAVYGAAGVG